MHAVLDASVATLEVNSFGDNDPVPLYAQVAAPILLFAGVDLTSYADVGIEYREAPKLQDLAYSCIEENKWRLGKIVSLISNMRRCNQEQLPPASVYDQLRISRIRRGIRYLSTLSSDPVETWVRPRDERLVQRAADYGRMLKL